MEAKGTFAVTYFHVMVLQASFTQLEPLQLAKRRSQNPVSITIATEGCVTANSSSSLQTRSLEIQRMVHGLFVPLIRVTQHILIYSLLVCVICYPLPSFVFFIDGITHSTEISTTEVGIRFFAVSTSLTQATPKSKKGLKRKGEEKKDKEKRTAQFKPKYALTIPADSDRSESRLSRSGTFGSVSLSAISTLLIATSDMSFSRLGHLESNHCKRITMAVLQSYHPSIRISLNLLFRYLAPPRLCQQLQKAFTLMKNSSELAGEKTGQGGQYLQVTSSRSNDKNKKESPPDTRSEESIVRFKYDDNEGIWYSMSG
ncbi:hypothetical protein K435DRAFT_907209 [Dendrothele bispora CBS 962.96]|uniref:Uncharacterized protein n=1 Tax=Dendrothele bispora (strain CBS 962.96) TaxID=1314807 RepID=A0A4S8LS23_DENBC|nr:hypothetical protein K435DRAFT_907209 [Dendrothele bispora CBS 962.96]